MEPGIRRDNDYKLIHSIVKRRYVDMGVHIIGIPNDIIHEVMRLNMRMVRWKLWPPISQSRIYCPNCMNGERYTWRLMRSLTNLLDPKIYQLKIYIMRQRMDLRDSIWPHVLGKYACSVRKREQIWLWKKNKELYLMELYEYDISTNIQHDTEFSWWLL